MALLARKARNAALLDSFLVDNKDFTRHVGVNTRGISRPEVVHSSGKVFIATNVLHILRFARGGTCRRWNVVNGLCCSDEINIEDLLQAHVSNVQGDDALSFRLRQIELALIVHGALCFALNMEVPTLAETLSLAGSTGLHLPWEVLKKAAIGGNHARHLNLQKLGNDVMERFRGEQINSVEELEVHLEQMSPVSIGDEPACKKKHSGKGMSLRRQPPLCFCGQPARRLADGTSICGQCGFVQYKYDTEPT